MGVKGLTSFVEQHFSRWQTKEIRGRLVVDGNNLVFSLYKADWVYGGQYPEFRQECVDYFTSLQRNGIVPIVVFDGVDHEQQKVATIMKRRRETIDRMHKGIAEVRANKDARRRNDSIPLACNIVLCHTLTELGVEHYHTDGEADEAIVHIANHYCCPVVSYDSDFFLYDLKGGYISSKAFYWRASPIAAEVYYVHEFAEQFHLHHKSLRCAIPAVVENDFLSLPSAGRFLEYVTEESGSSSTIGSILRFASQFADLEALMCAVDGMECAVDKQRLKSNCREARSMYDDTRTVQPADLMEATILKDRDGHFVPMWVIREFRIGSVHSVVLEAVVLGKCVLHNAPDDTSQTSASVCSQRLRQFIYSLLEQDSVTELFRHGLDLSGEEVDAITMVDSRPLPTLADIPTLCPLERELLFISMLCCDPMSIDKVDSCWKFVVCSLVYWSTAGHVPERLVKALLLCFLICSAFNAKELRTLRARWRMTQEYHKNRRWQSAHHHFAQWQHVYYDAWQLNALLLHPLETVSPACLYDGRIALYIAGSLNIDSEGQAASSIKPVSHQLYLTLLDAVKEQVHCPQQVTAQPVQQPRHSLPRAHPRLPPPPSVRQSLPRAHPRLPPPPSVRHSLPRAHPRLPPPPSISYSVRTENRFADLATDSGSID